MFKFTLRDLFWLTIVAAILCGWWLQHRREQQASAMLTSENERLRLSVVQAEVDKAVVETLHSAAIAGINVKAAENDLQAARERWKLFESMSNGKREVVPGVAVEIPPPESIR
jgi:hypothetical protein